MTTKLASTTGRKVSRKPADAASQGTGKPAASRASAGKRVTPPRVPRTPAAPAPRLRLRLNSIDDVKKEMGRLYREGKAGKRDVGNVSRLANVLAIMGRLIEGSELEARIAAIEKQQRKAEE
jgi:hypothetical protein